MSNIRLPSRNFFVISVLQGFGVSLVLSFIYISAQSDLSDWLAKDLDYLRQIFNGYGFTWSLIAILFTAFFYYTKRKLQPKNGSSPLLCVISIVFGILNVCGLMMFYMDDLPFFRSFSWLLIAVFLTAGWSILFYYVAQWVLLGFEWISCNEQKWKFGFSKNSRWVFAGVIFLCWLPWMIVYYPASMDWDVYRQLCSALDYGYYATSNHDPWLASCVLAGFYKIGLVLGNQNLGIFIFVFVRNICISLIYGDCITRLSRGGISKKICIGMLLFYAITPVWGAYAKHAFKDTFATALFCAYITALITVVMQSTKKELRWKSCGAYVFFSAAAALMRNNFIYVIAPVTLVLVLWLLLSNLGWKKSVIMFLGIFIYLGFNQYIFDVVGVHKGSSREALSIPFQQTARTVKYHGDEITEEQRLIIDSVLDYSTMAEVYDPLVSDPIKDKYKETALSEYFKVWLKMLFQFPDTYIEATVGGSYGYYAFTPKHPVHAGNWNSGLTVFTGIDVPAFDDFGFDFSYAEGTQGMRDAMNQWVYVWDSLPVLSITDTIAAYTWVIVLMGSWLHKNKKYPELIVIFAMLIMILTCIASPVNDAFRYYSPVAAGFPALALLCKNKKDSEGKEVVLNG